MFYGGGLKNLIWNNDNHSPLFIKGKIQLSRLTLIINFNLFSYEIMYSATAVSVSKSGFANATQPLSALRATKHASGSYLPVKMLIYKKMLNSHRKCERGAIWGSHKMIMHKIYNRIKAPTHS